MLTSQACTTHGNNSFAVNLSALFLNTKCDTRKSRHWTSRKCCKHQHMPRGSRLGHWKAHNGSVTWGKKSHISEQAEHDCMSNLPWAAWATRSCHATPKGVKHQSAYKAIVSMCAANASQVGFKSSHLTHLHHLHSQKSAEW